MESSKLSVPRGDIEMQGLVGPGAPSGPGRIAKRLGALGNRVEDIKMSVDDRWNVKSLCRAWGPRVEYVVRLMLLSTFLNDSLDVALHFPEQAEQIRWGAWGSVLLLAGLVAQSAGALCLLLPALADPATLALIAWTVIQPALYAQLANAELVSESLTLVGGLLTLRARLVPGVGDRTRLAGRLLLPAAYLRYAGESLLAAATPDETGGVATYFGDLSLTAIQVATLVVVVLASALVAAGLQSRVIALLLAVVNLAVVTWQHPFFLWLRREGGQWGVDEDAMPMPSASGVLPGDLDPWQTLDLHRYYFFMGLSTSGALLTLAMFGPGGMAVQKAEELLPTRAKD